MIQHFQYLESFRNFKFGVYRFGHSKKITTSLYLIHQSSNEKYMSDATHLRSTRWEPQLDAEKIHELGGRVLRLLHCEKTLHGFHFQATLFFTFECLEIYLSITATLSSIVTVLFCGMSAKRGPMEAL